MKTKLTLTVHSVYVEQAKLRKLNISEFLEQQLAQAFGLPWPPKNLE